jgi:WD40 repeat protein
MQVQGSGHLDAGGDVRSTLAPTKGVRLLTSGRREGRLIARHRSAVTSVAFSPDGNLVASGGSDGRVWLGDRTTQAIHVFVTEAAIARVAFSPDGKRLAAAGASVRVWTIEAQTSEWVPGTSAVVDGRGEIATP